MERVVESIRVPRPRRARRGVPTRAVPLPRRGLCVFAGSPAALAGHFAAAHGWPCATVEGGGSFVCLLHGFNFITAAAADKGTVFLLDVKRAPPFGRAVAAF
ncbi:hypothetical protein HU200_020487 [Digitaria exilis]|uniref:Uncharacterized protein n=1 Tax=Digitaria exilis TaxID=1010633 RepID=A0A835F248_9POAL|nr:hypothetical protein HU200_020487 [Digitaria exilis]